MSSRHNNIPYNLISFNYSEQKALMNDIIENKMSNYLKIDFLRYQHARGVHEF